MSEKHLQLEPHDIDEHHWWYEEAAGIVVVAEEKDDNGGHIATTVTKIRWSQLRKALARKDKK